METLSRILNDGDGWDDCLQMMISVAQSGRHVFNKKTLILHAFCSSCLASSQCCVVSHRISLPQNTLSVDLRRPPYYIFISRNITQNFKFSLLHSSYFYVIGSVKVGLWWSTMIYMYLIRRTFIFLYKLSFQPFICLLKVSSSDNQYIVPTI